MHTAVVIVHGVGDPKDGDALHALVDGLRDTGWRLAAPSEIERRVEPGDPADGAALVNTYPVHRAVLEQETAAPRGQGEYRLDLHEVYWGDLSRVKGSASGLIVGLFDLIFGMRHVAHAAWQDALRSATKLDGGSGGRLTSMVHRAGNAALACERVARGLMLALNILVAAVALLQWGLGHVPDLPWPTAPTAAVVAPLLVVVIALLLRRTLQKRQWSLQTLKALLVLGLTGAVLGCYRTAVGHAGHHVLVEPATSAMSAGAALMALYAMTMLLLSGWGAWRSWYTEGLPQQVTAQPTPGQALRRSLLAMNFSIAFGVGLFILVVMIIWAAVSTRVDAELAARIRQGMHLFAMVWLAFLGLAAGFWVVAFFNGRINRWNQRPRHRYLVHPWVCGAFLALSFVYAALFVPLIGKVELEAWCGRAQQPAQITPSMDGQSCSFMVIACPTHSCGWSAPNGSRLDCAGTPEAPKARQEAPKCAGYAAKLWDRLAPLNEVLTQPIEALLPGFLLFTALVLSALAMLRPHLLLAVDLMLDVVAYFQRGGGPQRQTHPAWDAITRRFADVFQAASADADRVVVLSHSQGTMVALHALGLLRAARRSAMQRDIDAVPVDLVTMGSPADHLYRYYMSGDYEVAPRGETGVRHWINLYRLDDFIGTRLEFGGPMWPRNLALAPRGHTDYWRDREALQHLSPFLSPGAGVPPIVLLEHAKFVHEHGGKQRQVHVRGSRGGIPLLLMHELPGLSPACLALAERLAGKGFRVYMPLLLGHVGQHGLGGMVANLGRMCIQREFRELMLAEHGQGDSSLTQWLLSLAKHIQQQNLPYNGVGVIGMCLTGSFAMAMVLDPVVAAAVVAQPSLPMSMDTGLRRALGLSACDQALLRKRLQDEPGPCLRAVRFAGDRISPPERAAALQHLLEGLPASRFKFIELPSGEQGVPANAHATLTEDYDDRPGHPTRQAFDELVTFLRTGVR